MQGVLATSRTQGALEVRWEDRSDTVFWNEKADSYSKAELTNEAPEELEALRELAAELSPETILSLGCADGRRDPIPALELLMETGHTVKKVLCNDLSPLLLDRAAANMALVPKEACMQSLFRSGPMHLLGSLEGSQPEPKALLVGAYRFEMLLAGGLRSYIRNSRLVGDRLSFGLYRLQTSGRGNRAQVIPLPLTVGSSASSRDLAAAEGYLNASVREAEQKDGANLGVHVRGTFEADERGVFSSAWFTRKGLAELLRLFFSPDRYSVSINAAGKCWLCRINPRDSKPRGLVTLLNNVLGNILPHELTKSLSAVRRMLG